MEFRDLKRQYEYNKEKIDGEIQKVIESTQFIGGNPVDKLEKRLASYVGVKNCITCANGTDALQLALMAMGIQAMDAVFVPDFTFFATAEVIPWVGAIPIFVDIDKETFNISADSLENAIVEVIKEGKYIPKAVIAVDLFGQPADYIKIREITNKFNLLLIEDGAQGFGGNIEGKKACSFGDISTTSFFPAKPLGCYGDGGAIFTDNDEWVDLIKSYKVHGKGINKYDNVRIGMNSRLDTIQAAVLLAKFDIFINEELESVNKVAHFYNENLNHTLEVPKIKKGYYSSWAQYTVRLRNNKERDSLQEYLQSQQIPTMIYYGKPMHSQKAFEKEKQYVDLSITSEVCDRVLSLPMHPYLEEGECEFVCNKIKEFVRKIGE